jgi:hypothetical protein
VLFMPSVLRKAMRRKIERYCYSQHCDFFHISSNTL